MNKAQTKLNSKIGPLYLVASNTGLQGIYWTQQPCPLTDSFSQQTSAIQHLSQAVVELTEYFMGNRKAFTVTLDLIGTPFQRDVWEALLQIPYGETRSYLDIARGISREKAVRAVGSANGRNPVCIIIPCHRVIAASGKLGGYSGGLQIKKQLLELEHGR